MSILGYRPSLEQRCEVSVLWISAAMPHPEEATFRVFDPAKASDYSAIRGSHPSALYDIIYDFHRSGSVESRFGTCVDVGCGPGNSTKPLLEEFDRVVGVDPSQGMIAAAKRTLDDQRIEFLTGQAEDMGQVKEADMITAANAVRSLPHCCLVRVISILLLG